jgi:uncharacterized protein Yka (UPF0111/DUF47 family)
MTTDDVIGRALEHVWYSHDSPLVQELIQEIDKLQKRILSMGNSTTFMYNDMADSREALKAQRDAYKQRLEDALEVLRSVAATRDELLAIVENATEVAKGATEEIVQLRNTLSVCRATIKHLLENHNDRV